MNPTKEVLSNSVDAKANQKRSLEKTSTEKSPLGHRLADSMAAEVGSKEISYQPKCGFGGVGWLEYDARSSPLGSVTFHDA